MFKLWAFSLKISRHDTCLDEVDAALAEFGVPKMGAPGVRLLVHRARQLQSDLREKDQRVRDLENLTLVQARALEEKRVAEVYAPAASDHVSTPIEQAVRQDTGIDLGVTSRNEVYDPELTELNPIVRGDDHE